jgi:hypothetical protein
LAGQIPLPPSPPPPNSFHSFIHSFIHSISFSLSLSLSLSLVFFWFFSGARGVGVCSLYYGFVQQKQSPWSTLSLERFVIPLVGCVKQKKNLSIIVFVIL